MRVLRFADGAARWAMPAPPTETAELNDVDPQAYITSFIAGMIEDRPPEPSAVV